MLTKKTLIKISRSFFIHMLYIPAAIEKGGHVPSLFFFLPLYFSASPITSPMYVAILPPNRNPIPITTIGIRITRISVA
jgi:hypothetical protein